MKQTQKQKRHLDKMAAELLGLKPCESIQHIPEGISGPFQIKNDVNIDHGYIYQTLYRNKELISNNDPVNLHAHKHIIKKAHGRVLVSGLGLGASLHELLKKEGVSYIRIVETEQDIIDMVAPSFPDPRVEFIHADIFYYETDEQFDYIYHALWNDEKMAKTGVAVNIRKILKEKFDHLCHWHGFAYISPRGGGGRGAGRKPGSTGPYKKVTRSVKKGVRYFPKEFAIIERAAELSGKTPAEIAAAGAVKEAARILFKIDDSDLEKLVKKAL